MSFNLKKYLVENKLMQESPSKINMRTLYNILKTNGFGPEIVDGNQVTGIKSINFGSYDKKTGRDGGRLSIDSNGELFGQDNWGMDIKDANEILDAIEQYRIDQYNLENPLNEAKANDLYYTAGEMSFDYRAYLKNNPLLEEFPKNQWTGLDKKETEEYSGDIFALIDTAYASIGGNLNYSNAGDVTGAEGDADYEVINIDDDPEIDAVVVSKSKEAGNKLTAIGHDNSSIAKSKAINKSADLLKTSGNYIEVSGRIKDILLAKGVPIVTDKSTIKKVMGNKAIDIQDDGSYTRYISGKETHKILLGKPSV